MGVVVGAGSSASAIVVDGSHDFSFGGWFRPVETQFTYADTAVLMSAWNTSGRILALGVSGTTPFVTIGSTTSTGVPAITDNQWHYLLATFVAGAGSGELVMWVDGAFAGQNRVTVTSPETVASWQVGLSAAEAYCRTAMVWSRCLQPPNLPQHQPGEVGPDWAVPAPATGLGLGLDLSVSPPVDRSASGLSVGADQFLLADLTPALSLPQGEYATPSAVPGLNPGADSPFSVAAWVQPQPQLTGAEPSLQAIISNGPVAADTSFLLGLQDTANGTFKPVACLGEFQNQLAGSGTIPANQWSHVAATFDGQKLALYVNGVAVGSTTSQGSGSPTTAELLFGAVSDGAGGIDLELAGYLQAIAFWPSCLSASQVADAMTDGPAEDSDCQAFYPFASGEAAEIINGLPVGLSPGASISEIFVPAPDQSSNARSARAEPARNSGPAAAGALVAWPSLLDLHTAAEASDDAPRGTVFAPGQRERIIADYDALLQRLVPTDLHTHYRSLFVTNLDLGDRLAVRADGPLPGTVTHRFEDADTIVFSVHTIDGPVDLATVRGARVLTPCTIFWLEISASSFGLLLALFGVGYTSVAVARYLKSAANAAVNGLAMATSELATQTVTGVSIINVVKAINVAGMLEGALWAGITGGSWWGIGWTIFSVTGQLLALFSTGGALLAYYVGALAYNLAALIVTLANRPSGCNPVPTLYGMFPNTAVAGSQGATLQLIGKRIMPAATAQWNGVDVTTTVASTTQATAQLTAANLASAGVGTITLTNPSSSGPSTGLTFTVTS